MAGIVVYSESNIANDPRVYRQVMALVEDHKVFCVGKGDSNGLPCEVLQIDKLILRPLRKGSILQNTLHSLQQYGLWVTVLLFLKKCSRGTRSAALSAWIERHVTYRYVIEAIKKTDFDIVIANELSALNKVCPAAGERKIVFDAHEYSPEQHTGEIGQAWRRRANFLLRKYLPRIDAVTTVSEGIANEYAQAFGISKPTVITNAPQFVDLEPVAPSYGTVRLVHHGGAIRRRKLEMLLETVEQLGPGYTLDFFLVPQDKDYLDELKVRASSLSNVRFNEPVPMVRLAQTLNRFDVGVYSLPPDNLNHKLALPNKLFEFVQARLAIAIGPSPEMARYVKQYGLGVIARDFTPSAMAEALKELDKDAVYRYKQNCNEYAYELSAGRQKDILTAVVDTVLT